MRIVNKYKDTIVGVASICISVLLFIATFYIQEFSRTRLGAGFVPRVTAVILFILGVILIVKEVRTRRTDAPPEQAGDARPVPRVGIMGPPAVFLNILLFVVYLLLLNSVGYLIMTPIYLFLQILLLTDPAKYRYGAFIVLSLIVGVGTYYGFAWLFQVYLPSGDLLGDLWTAL